MQTIIIAAVANNWVIGHDNSLPWPKIVADMRWFKEQTLNYPVIMGRNTFESLQKRLPQRLNIALSTRGHVAGCGITCNSLKKAIEVCRKLTYSKVFVIGGGKVYKEALESADQVILTVLHMEPQGDTYFPIISPSLWGIISQRPFTDNTGITGTFVHFVRRG